MNYLENELLFIPQQPIAKTLYRGRRNSSAANSSDLLGIKVRIGNRPLVYNLKTLAQDKLGSDGGLFTTDVSKEFYLVVHAIGAVRTQGSARVEELQYFAAALEEKQVQTIDLVPNTRFKELLAAGLDFELALSSSGEIMSDLPQEFLSTLMALFVPVGGNMRLQLSGSAAFIGRFSFRLHMALVQSMGIGSSTCCWVLSPGHNGQPLLGDQLLLQTIAVPRGTKKISYNISALVKADKGLLWKQQQLQTPEHIVEVNLNNPFKRN